MRKWWLILPLAMGVGVAAYFWFFSGLWMCGHVDSSVETLDAVSALTAVVVEVVEPTVTLSSDRYAWSATVTGEVSSVLFEDAGSAPASIDILIFGMRSVDFSSLAASEPLVVSLDHAGSVVAVSDRPDGGGVVWLSAPYVDPAMPDTISQWVQTVEEAHGA